MKIRTFEEKRDLVLKHYSQAYGVKLSPDIKPLEILDLYKKMQLLAQEEHNFREQKASLALF